MKLRIFTDGAARGNPGPAGIGIVIYNEKGEILEQHYQYVGTATNNIAEYEALVAALKLAGKYVPCSVQIHSDSELMVRQMMGRYKVKNEVLLVYFKTAQALSSDFVNVHFVHVPREQNKLADKLANQAINLVHPIAHSSNIF
jgi:ribonuclease HI